MIVSVRFGLWIKFTFKQHGSRCRMWIPPEIKDPVLLHHPTRKSVGYFGAVSIKDGSFVYRQEKDKFNAQSFYEFLKQLEEITAARGSKAILITDNARYHHAVLHKEWRKSVSEHFESAFLPPYSPELNPIEQCGSLCDICAYTINTSQK